MSAKYRQVVTLARDDSDGSYVILKDGELWRRWERPSDASESWAWESLYAQCKVGLWRCFNEVMDDRTAMLEKRKAHDAR